LTATGFPGEEVKFMTKHKMDIFLKDYCCPINIRVSRALAGFNPLDANDKYYVPRTNIEMPGGMSVEQVTSLLFPNIHRWRDQLQSPTGDKVRAQSATHFLYKILPFLAEVCIQDGIYWVKDFPQNTSTMLLFQRLENKTGPEHYSVFAQRGRATVEKWQMDEEKKSAALEDKVDRLTNEISSLHKYCEQQFTVLQSSGHQPVALGQTSQYSMQQHYNVQQPEEQRVPIQQDVPILNLTALRDFNTPLKPTILPLNAYRSLKNLVSLSMAHHHHTIQINMAANRWNDPKRDRMNWSKIKLLYKRIDDCRGTQPDNSPKTRLEMAEILDTEERKDMSLESYWKWIRSFREYEPRKRKR
jgi:hypothetical protein